MKAEMVKEQELAQENKTYEFIGRLALALFSQNIQMTFTALRQVLKDNKLREYASNRGMARGVSAAYTHWKKQEQQRGIKTTCTAIADTFVNKQTRRAWDK